ncbi:hypothetical protein [Tsuneonella suprasediminis]|uniref:hypothetical protein n=1 Tax=Tsuneonella suprasediminis TaxID=2306996 RepID=UPI002F947314
MIGSGDRKSFQPIAARSNAILYNRLYHFIVAGLWESRTQEVICWKQADELVGGDGSRLLAVPKAR